MKYQPYTAELSFENLFNLVFPNHQDNIKIGAFLVLSMQNSPKLDAEEALGVVFKGVIKPKLIYDRLMHY